MRLSVLLALVACVARLDALAVPPRHQIHERRDYTPARWTKRDRVESHKLLPMRIGLTQTNLEKGHGHLMDV